MQVEVWVITVTAKILMITGINVYKDSFIIIDLWLIVIALSENASE